MKPWESFTLALQWMNHENEWPHRDILARGLRAPLDDLISGLPVSTKVTL